MIMRSLILAATAALAVVLLRWADMEFMSGSGIRREGLGFILSRLTNDWQWICVAATVGAAAMHLASGRLKRPASAGAIVVAVASLVTLGTIAMNLLLPPASGQALQHRIFHDLRTPLQIHVPGAIIGAWVASIIAPRRCRRDSLEVASRLVGWMWMLDPVVLIFGGFLS
jgi:hypothetical protein